MKKLFLSFLLANLLFIQLEAEEEYVINIVYDKAPTYLIKLPKKVDVTDNETKLNYYVKADIYANQKLNVIFQEHATISDNHRTFDINVVQEKKTYTYEEISETYKKYSLTISHVTLPAGKFSGNLNVEINLEDSTS